MKTVLTILSLCLCLVVCGQNQKPGNNPASVQNVLQAVKHDTCLDKKFSVVFYLFQDSMNTLNTANPSTYSSYSLTAFINKANALFKNICVSFEHCKTVIIPDYTINKWKLLANGMPVLRNYYTENTICIFIPTVTLNWLPDDPEESYGFKADTVAPLRNAIICTKGGISSATPESVYHALGHFFGLPHTYMEINPNQATTPPTPAGIVTKEFADMSNCATHGDGFCDTEADPFPNLGQGPKSQANCVGVNVRDGKNRFYTPPFENIMSMYGGCRCKFSHEQYDYMAHYILRKRMYLH